MQGVIEGHILIVLLDYIIPVKSQFFLKQKNLYTVLILSVVVFFCLVFTFGHPFQSAIQRAEEARGGCEEGSRPEKKGR